MPDISGMEVLQQIANNHPEASVLTATAFNDAPTDIEAVKPGAHDYVIKPFNQDGKEARIRCCDYVRFYNTERPQQSLDYRTPAEVFTLSLVAATQGDMIKLSVTHRTAGPPLNLALILP